MGIKRVSRIVAGGMLRSNTPIEDHTAEYGLWVKREDKSCPKPGPPFSKTRGVYARVKSVDADLIGVLDTRHSQAGHAVARACQILKKKCVNYYPAFKAAPEPKAPQLAAKALGAELTPLPAGRSSILFHQARRDCEDVRGGYMMPNALKLPESVEETAKEVPDMDVDVVLVPISSGTIAAGVIQGFHNLGMNPLFLIHLGYTRSHDQVTRYLYDKSGVKKFRMKLIDEDYQYKDMSRDLVDVGYPEWPCNPYYDLKAFHWWLRNRKRYASQTCLFWNIG